MVVCVCDLRDNEDAFVSVNGETCWRETNLVGTAGTQQCGGVYKEERFRVTGCYVTLRSSVGGKVPLRVRVWTSLDAGPDDESFGIDNVVVAKLGRKGKGDGLVKGFMLFLHNSITHTHEHTHAHTHTTHAHTHAYTCTYACTHKTHANTYT